MVHDIESFLTKIDYDFLLVHPGERVPLQFSVCVPSVHVPPLASTTVFVPLLVFVPGPQAFEHSLHSTHSQIQSMAAIKKMILEISNH